MHIYPLKHSTSQCHHNPLTELQKGRILEARGLGRTFTEISEELNIPWSTVITFLGRFQELDSAENLPHTGRPRKTSAQYDRALICTALVHTDVSYSVLRDITKFGSLRIHYSSMPSRRSYSEMESDGKSIIDGRACKEAA